jgi:WD40 repeat protein
MRHLALAAMFFTAYVAVGAAPAISIEPIEDEQSDDIEVRFALEDADNGELSIVAARFAEVGRDEWYTATLNGKTEGLAPGPDQSVIWVAGPDVTREFPTEDDLQVRLELTVSDGEESGTGEVTGITVDYNEPPVVTSVGPVPDPSFGDIDIAYTLFDPENDVLSVRVEYSLDGGPWLAASISSGTSTIVVRDRYSGFFRWHSRTSAPDPGNAVVVVRLTVGDRDEGGQLETNRFHLTNTPPPEVLITGVAKEPGQDVRIDYSLSSVGNRTLALTVQFTTNGAFWQNAIVDAADPRVDLLNIRPDQYTGTLVWPIVSNPARDYRPWDISVAPNVSLTPRDEQGDGNTAETGRFVVTNVAFPYLNYDSVQAPTGGINAVAFDTTGLMFATGGDDGYIRVWDITDRRQIGAFAGPEGHTGAVRSVAFSPDGIYIASVGDDGRVIRWERATGAPTRLRPVTHSEGSFGVAFSPDGSRIASGGGRGILALWDAHTGARINQFQAHSVGITAVAFSPDGEVVAAASRDATVSIRSVPAGELRRTLYGHAPDTPVTSIAFGPNASPTAPEGAYLLASGGVDRNVRIWDIKAGAYDLRVLEGHPTPVTGVSFSYDGALLASTSVDGRVNVWDLHEQDLWRPGGHNLMRTLAGQAGASANSVAFWTSEHLLASADSDGAVLLWSSTGVRDNRAPTLSVTAPGLVSEGTTAVIRLNVSDDTPGGVRVSVAETIRGLRPDPGDPSGRSYLYTPQFTQQGRHTVTFSASDGRLGFAQTAHTIDVVDRDPFQLSLSSSRTVAQGAPVAITAELIDRDVINAAGGVTLEMADKPDGATFNHLTGKLEWTPAFYQEGLYEPAIVAMQGDDVVQSEELRITVTETPVFVFPTGTVWNAAEGVLFGRSVLTQPARGAVQVSVGDGLPGMSVDAQGTFTFTPSFTQAPRHDFTLTATQDGRRIGSTAMVLEVTEAQALSLQANVAPNADGSFSIDAGGSIEVTVVVAPAVGSGVTLSTDDRTPNAELRAAERTFVFAPGFDQDGTHSFTVTAMQRGLEVGSLPIVVVVRPFATDGVVILTPALEGSGYSVPEGEAFEVAVGLDESVAGRLSLDVSGSTGIVTFAEGRLSLLPDFAQSGKPPTTVTMVVKEGATVVGERPVTFTVTNTPVLSLLSSPASGTINEGETLTVTATLTRAAVAAGVTMRVLERPDGAPFARSGRTGVLSFTPDYTYATEGNATASRVVVQARQGEEEADRETAPMRVRNVTPLTLSDADDNALAGGVLRIPEGDVLRIRAVLSDGGTEDKPVTLSLDNGPRNATGPGVDRWVVFRPDFTQGGDSHQLAVVARQDGAIVGRAAQSVVVTEEDPVRLEPAQRLQIAEAGRAVVTAVVRQIAVGQTDPITIEAGDRPSTAEFDAGTMVFEPDYTQARDGDYELEFVARQRGVVVWSGTALVHVSATPILSLDREPPTSVAQGDSLTVTVVLDDEARGDGVTLSVEDRPPYAAFDPVSGRLTVSPELDRTGRYSPVVVARQNGDEADRITIVGAIEGTTVLTLSPTSQTVEEYVEAVATIAVDALAQGKVTVRQRSGPANVTFTESTGRIGFKPDFTQGGTTHALWFEAMDGEVMVDEARLQVRVDEVDVLSVGGPESVREGDAAARIPVFLHPRAVGVVSLSTTDPLPAGVVWRQADALLEYEPSFVGEDRRMTFTLFAREATAEVDREVVTIDVQDRDVLTVTPAGTQTSVGVPLRIPVLIEPSAVDRVDISVEPSDIASYADGAVVFSPSFTQAGDHPIVVTVRENGNFVESDEITVTALDQSALSLNPPAGVSTPEGVAASVGIILSAAARAEGVVVELGSAPRGVELLNGTVVFTPDFTQAGAHEAWVVAKQDGVEIDRRPARFDVSDVSAFAAGLPARITLDEGAQFGPLDVELVDTATPDMTIEAVGPAFVDGEEFDPNTGRWTFTPDYSQAGEHTVTFRALQRPEGVAEVVGVWAPTIVVTDVPQDPTVSVLPVADGAIGDIEIGYVIDDFDRDPVSLRAEYRIPDEDWHEATTDGDLSDIPQSRYAGVLTWRSRADVPSSGEEEAEFRLTPTDGGGSGPAGMSGPFLLANLLGDYTDDGVVDIEDFLEFKVAWQSRDAAMDIGPAPGNPPELDPELDGKLDFADLAVFVVMWNWSHQNRPLAVPPHVDASAMGATGPIAVDTRAGTGGLDRQEMTLTWEANADRRAARIVVRYNPHGAIATPAFKADGADGRFVLVRHDAELGIVDAQFAWLGDVDAGALDLGVVRFARSGWMDSRVDVSFDAYDGSGVTRGQDSVLLRFERPPSSSRLLPNFPNPFNPETWIPFELASEATVTIDIYASDGTHVRSLSPGRLPAGRYTGRESAAHWAGANAAGESVAGGTYYCRLNAGSYSETRKLILAR